MNDFIVWDKENNIFFDRESNFDKIYSKTEDEMYCPEEMYTNWFYYIFGFDILRDSSDRLTSHDYIGKSDINNKKIYADSSIIEFEIFIINPDDTTSVIYTLNGFFTYNDIELRYEIDILDNNSFVCLNYNIENQRNFKIIDTLQENKLGLIK